MNEYELLGGLHEIIDEDIDKKVNKWLDSHNVNYWLLYPLAMVEIGAMKEKPESISNLFRRCVTSFIYSKAIEHGKELYIKKFNIPGLKKYIKEYENILQPLFQNYRFSREINDINPVSKAQLKPVGQHRYQLTTSLVTDKYSEEYFYFFGEDNPEKNAEEQKQTMNLHAIFWDKIIRSDTSINQLEKVIDKDLYNECIKIIDKDLNKWNARVKSSVFDSPRQISLVIAFFYYYAMIRSICVRIGTLEGEDYIDNADECIMIFDKEQCVHKISEISNIREDKVKKIIEYFTNYGNANLLEFPLFEVENKLISIPSLFIVNDWQFTVINGHYIKSIPIRNREKTISVVTEGRIEKIMCDMNNVAIAKTVPYSFIDKEGKLQNSDVDFAILDQKRNTALVIEAKWIDKHYGDEMDKRYGKILETLNSIYTKQISKHKQFLNSIENIEFLFRKDKRYVRRDMIPQLYYLAVDKRNQMHIDDRHMVSEYMLLYFLKKHCVDKEFNVEGFWNEINNLQTKFEYIPVSSDFYEIQVGEDMILVERDDLYWDS